ncbi:sensor histidine kinase [Homoserinimonas aerilata]|nr:histidine kinase [Homoserinimonas aerilata]
MLSGARRVADASIFDPWRAAGSLQKNIVGAVLFAAVALIPALGAYGVEFGDMPPRPSDLFAVLLTLAQCLPLAMRVNRPGISLVLVSSAFAAHQLLGYPPTIAGLGLFVAVYSVGRHQREWRAVVAGLGIVGYVGLAVAMSLSGSPDQPFDFATFFVVVAAAWAVGAGARALAVSRLAQQRLLAEAALSEERARIARELHDIVTHHVTAMVVQADAAQFIAPPPSGRLGESLAAISGTGRRALGELRYLLGTIDPGEPVSLPLAGSVEEIVATASSLGMPVSLVETGEPRELAGSVRLAMYRVVQESLTNARKHAPGSLSTVNIHHGTDAITVEVMTAPASSPVPGRFRAGRGIRGLEARVGLLGGELYAGPGTDGGFRVTAHIPTRSEQ